MTTTTNECLRNIPDPAAISLTRAQADWAEWAIDPMSDHWTTEEGAWSRGAPIIDEVHMPRLLRLTGIGQSRWLEIAHCPIDVREDFLYRLEEQAQDMEEISHASARCAMRLAERVRAALD